MPIARDVAKWFLNRVDREAGDSITHLKLQKLVYYAQAWHLAHFDEPIFQEEIKAWTHGPVTPSIWHEYKDCRWQSLSAPQDAAPQFDQRTELLLEAIRQSYGGFGAKQLEEMTHQELPWQEARGNLPLEARCDIPISRTTMRDYYRARLAHVAKQS